MTCMLVIANLLLKVRNYWYEIYLGPILLEHMKILQSRQGVEGLEGKAPYLL